jgi:hypothetical protein
MLIVAAIVAAPVHAFATEQDANNCAKGLQGDALKTYRAAVQNVIAGDTLEVAFTKVLKPQVDSGKMQEDYARKIGREAGECARLVHREPGK